MLKGLCERHNFLYICRVQGIDRRVCSTTPGIRFDVLGKDQLFMFFLCFGRVKGVSNPWYIGLLIEDVLVLLFKFLNYQL